MFGNKVIRKPEHDVVPRQGEVREPVEWAELLPVPVRVAVATCTCGHADDDHDAIARRYCGATIAAALSRGCICATPPADHHR